MTARAGVWTCGNGARTRRFRRFSVLEAVNVVVDLSHGRSGLGLRRHDWLLSRLRHKFSYPGHRPSSFTAVPEALTISMLLPTDS